MDLSNTKNKRLRVDFQYSTPPTVEDWRHLLAVLEKEEYETPTGYYPIEKINSIFIQTKALGTGGGVEVVVYMDVDLGKKIDD